jgi:hypothetical protein
VQYPSSAAISMIVVDLGCYLGKIHHDHEESRAAARPA